MTDTELENEKSIKSFMVKKYLIDFGTLILILGSVFIFRWFNFLDNALTGTLIGATIGYFGADIKKIHK